MRRADAGVATAATRALSEHAFATGTARLELRTEPENGPSQRVALAAGFRHEGSRAVGRRVRDGEPARPDRLGPRSPAIRRGPAARLLPDLPGGVLTDGVVTLRPLARGRRGATYRLHSLPEVVATRCRRCRRRARRSSGAATGAERDGWPASGPTC